MIRRIQAIARTTFWESIRNKVLYSMLFFALALIALSALLGTLAMGDLHKIIRDVGLAGIHVLTIGISIVAGINLMVQEINRRSIYVLLANPLPRWALVVGKWIGLAALMAVEFAILTVAFFLVLWVANAQPALPLLLSLAAIYVECLVIIAFAILFSGLASPVVSSFSVLSLWVIGHLASDLEGFARKSDSTIMRISGEWLSRIVPNLEVLNFKHTAVHLQPIDLGHFAGAVAYGMGWCVLILAVACLVYQRKDFAG